MRLPQLLRYLSTQIWACEPRFLARGQLLLQQAVGGRLFTGAMLHAELGIPTPEAEAMQTDAGVAVIPIHGVIVDHASSLGTSARDIGAMLRGALASRQVDAILFDVDSPGGIVMGIPELADEIRAAQAVKPMAAYNGGLMASAAYWLGAAAGDVTATKSSETGSIGVYTWHEDWSKHLEQEGIAITEVSRGKYKTEGAPWKALSADAQAELDARVEEVYGWFLKSVAADRRTTPAQVRDGYGQGRVLGAERARAANLIDRVGTFAEAVRRLTERASRKVGRGRAGLERERLALDSAAVMLGE